MINISENKKQGKLVEILGEINGSNVELRDVHSSNNKSIDEFLSGNLREYINSMQKYIDVATHSMVEKGQDIGADAIIGIKYTSSSIADNNIEVRVSGTAIRYVEEYANE